MFEFHRAECQRSKLESLGKLLMLKSTGRKLQFCSKTLQLSAHVYSDYQDDLLHPVDCRHKSHL